MTVHAFSVNLRTRQLRCCIDEMSLLWEKKKKEKNFTFWLKFDIWRQVKQQIHNKVDWNYLHMCHLQIQRCCWNILTELWKKLGESYSWLFISLIKDLKTQDVCVNSRTAGKITFTVAWNWNVKYLARMFVHVHQEKRKERKNTNG